MEPAATGVTATRTHVVASAAVRDFIYTRAADVYTPTEWAGSPWSRELQHGGPVCGLIASAAEAAAAETGLRVVRLTVDLCRPTPFQPLTLSSRFLRRGRRLALVEVRLRHGDADVTCGTALLLAPNPALASTWRTPEPPPPGPEGLDGMFASCRARISRRRRRASIGASRCGSPRTKPRPGGLGDDAARPDRGAGDLGPGARRDAVGPHVRAERASCCCAAASCRATRARVALINADVTLYLERPPAGEWIAMRQRRRAATTTGIGVAEVVQLDRGGRYGRSLQALVSNAV